MSGKRNEEFTEIETTIMKQINHAKYRHILYKMLKDTETNSRLMIAVGNVKMLNFSLSSQPNLMGPIQGKILMDDFSSTCRELTAEQSPSPIREGAIRFCMAKICEQQYPWHREDTFVFDLNFCDMQNYVCDYDHGETLTNNFKAAASRSNLHDVFRKKWLIFPLFFRNEGYVTIVENGFTVVESNDENNSVILPCNIVHIGTTNMDYFEFHIAPRMKIVLELLFDILSPPLTHFNCTHDSTITMYRSLPKVEQFNKPFAFLWTLEMLVGDQRHIDQWPEMLEEIGGDGVKMKAEMDKLRDWLAIEMRNAINSGRPTEVALHLMDKRRRIAEYENSVSNASSKAKNDVDDDEEEEESDEDVVTKLALMESVERRYGYNDNDTNQTWQYSYEGVPPPKIAH